MKKDRNSTRRDLSGRPSHRQLQALTIRPAFIQPVRRKRTGTPLEMQAAMVARRLRAAPAFRGLRILRHPPALAIEAELRNPGLVAIVFAAQASGHVVVQWVENSLLKRDERTAKDCAEQTPEVVASLPMHELFIGELELALEDYAGWAVQLSKKPVVSVRQQAAVAVLAYELLQSALVATGTGDWKHCQRSARARLAHAARKAEVAR